MRIVELTRQTRKNILNDLLKRSPNNYGQYEATVNDIIKNVRENGDKALFEYTLAFVKFPLSGENIKITKEEIKAAYARWILLSWR